MGSLPISWQKGSDLLAHVRKWVKRVGVALGLVLLTVLAVRAYDAWRSPPVKAWHREVPHELDAQSHRCRRLGDVDESRGRRDRGGPHARSPTNYPPKTAPSPTAFPRIAR